MLVADFSGRVLSFNPAFDTMYGYTTGQAEANTLFGVLHPSSVTEVFRVISELVTAVSAACILCLLLFHR